MIANANLRPEYYEVYDKHTDELIARGPVVWHKTNNPAHTDLYYISFDGKWYLNIKENDTFYAKRIGYTEDVVIFDGPGKYEWKYWRDYKSPLVDLYRDFSIDEIDEEVKELVTELNMWDGVQTVGSCCGHGKGELWIQINVEDVHSINLILNVLRTPKLFPKMLDRFQIPIGSHQHQCMCYNPISTILDYHPCLSLVLMTTDIGERAYESARLFARYLKEVREMMEEKKRGDMDADVSGGHIQ